MMKNIHLRRKTPIPLSIVALLIFILLTPIPGEPKDEGTPAPELPAQTGAGSPKDLVDILSYSLTVSKAFVELTEKIKQIPPPDDLQTYIEKIEHEIKSLGAQLAAIRSAPYTGFAQLEDIKSKSNKIYYNLKSYESQLLKIIETLTKLNNNWTDNQEDLKSLEESVDRSPSLKLAEENISDMQDRVNQALQLISDKLQPFLAAQKKAADLEVNLHAFTINIGYLLKEIQKKYYSIFSPRFFSQFDMLLWENSWVKVIQLMRRQSELLSRHAGTIAGLGLFILFLALGIHHNKKRMTPSSPWYVFAERPVAAALFLFIAFMSLLDFFKEDVLQLPQSWETIEIIITLTVLLRLSRPILDSPWKKKVFTLLTISWVTILCLELTGISIVIYYFCVFAAAMVMGIVFLYDGRQVLNKEKNVYGGTALYLIAMFLFFIIYLMIMGYNQLALYSFNTLLKTCLYVLYFWILFQITKAFLEQLLTLFPLSLISQNSAAIVRQLSPLIIALYAFVMTVVLLQIWDIYQTKERALSGLLSLNISIGVWQISPGTPMAAAVVIYLAIIISRSAQSLLKQLVFPRYRVVTGVQFSIIRLAHYAILFIGFLCMLKVLGFELTNLTILGGALGVGLGFGLQAIVNNLASGLILLFERPVKVDDMIQVGTEVGEIQKIGLRATVVKTFDDAKIIIPNADLVTGQVINWTLTDRRVRVKVPVGVAYGTDTNRVLEILMACAEDHPMALSQPAPTALFLAFGDSSLNFELRVWIHEFSDRRLVHSELNQSIEEEFRLADITIPFPQRDLHIHPADALRPARLSENNGDKEKKEG